MIVVLGAIIQKVGELIMQVLITPHNSNHDHNNAANTRGGEEVGRRRR